MPSDEERVDKLLGGMMSYVLRGTEAVSFEQLSKDLGFMVRTTSWRNSWKKLISDLQFIEAVDPGAAVFTTDHRLTEAGKKHASTPEYEAFLKELNFVPQSNEEHQERIKKRLLNDKAVQIFDLLLQYGSLGRKELSTLLHCNDRQHKFSYGLKDLRTKNLVEKNNNMFSLTDGAFLDPSKDRPEPIVLDPELLVQGEAIVQSKKKGGKGEKKLSANAGKKRRKEDDGEEISSSPKTKKEKTEGNDDAKVEC